MSVHPCPNRPVIQGYYSNTCQSIRFFKSTQSDAITTVAAVCENTFIRGSLATAPDKKIGKLIMRKK